MKRPPLPDRLLIVGLVAAGIAVVGLAARDLRSAVLAGATLAFAGLAALALRRWIIRSVRAGQVRLGGDIESVGDQTDSEYRRLAAQVAALHERVEASAARVDLTAASLHETLESLDRAIERAEASGTASARIEADRAISWTTAGERRLRKAVDDVYDQVVAHAELQRILRIDGPMPLLRGWAISPDLALHLVRRLDDRSTRTVVELGSGSSTVLLAIALEHRGGEGHLVALDHDAEYADATRRSLVEHGVAHRATVLTTPLVDVVVDRETFPWYDVADVDLPERIDLLIVDGPPDTTGPLARFPAVPRLEARLGPGAVVVLDDGHRQSEKDIVERWTTRPRVSSVEHLRLERRPFEIIMGD